MEPLRRSPLLDLTLRSKRSVWARSYFVAETFAGLLNGAPSEESNERELRALAASASRHSQAIGWSQP